MRITFFFALLFIYMSSARAQVNADAGPDKGFCINEKLTLTGAGLNTGDTGTYQWKDLSSGTITNSKTMIQAIPFTGYRTFELTVTRNHNSITYTDKDSCMITGYGLPIILLGAPDTVCSGGGLFQLRSNYSINDTNGTWSGPFVTGSTFDPSQSPKTKQYEGSGKGYKIYFTYTHPLTKCTNKDSLYKMIQSQPEITITTLKPYQQCEGQPFMMNAIFKWAKACTWTSNGDGIFSSDNRQKSPNYIHGIQDTANGSVILTVTADKEGVCAQASDNVTLIIEPYPQFTMPPHYVGCEPVKFDFKSNVFNAGKISNLRYSWDFGNGQTMKDSKTDNPKGIAFPATKEGWYDVKLMVINQWGTDSSKSCRTTKDSSDYVKVLPQPNVGFTSDPPLSTTVDFPQFSFINTSTIKWGQMNYLWNFNIKDPDDTSTQVHPVHTYPADTGIYRVNLIATYSYHDTLLMSYYTCWDTTGQIRVIVPKGDNNIRLLTLVQNSKIALILPYTGTLKLMDFNGRITETRSTQKRREEFDISSLASGVYYFVLDNGSSRKILSFVKY